MEVKQLIVRPYACQVNAYGQIIFSYKINIDVTFFKKDLSIINKSQCVGYYQILNWYTDSRH